MENSGKSEAADFLFHLFSRGFNHILERIILTLPPRTALICTQVSREWRKMVQQLQSSTVPRISHIRGIRISTEWKQRNPLIKTSQHSLVHYTNYFHMIADESNVVIAGEKDWHSYGAEIFVLDAKNLSLLKYWEVGTSMCGVIEIILAFDENYLIANVHGMDSNLNHLDDNRTWAYFIWDRKNNYKLLNINPVASDIDHIGTSSLYHRGPNQIQYIPVYNNGILKVPVGLAPDDESYQIEYEEWNIAQNTKQTTTRVLTQIPLHSYYIPRNSSNANSYFAFKTTADEGSISLRGENSGELIWEKSHPGRYARLVDMTDDYAAVLWPFDTPGLKNLLEIYSMTTGELIQVSLQNNSSFENHKLMPDFYS